jgi:hypothetical protein
MKPSYKTLCLSAILVVCSGCAQNAVGGLKSQTATAAVEARSCDESVNERVYRNPFLRARNISQHACAE